MIPQGREIITRQEAKERGLARYFPGSECTNGHVSDRITNNGTCCECSKIRVRDYYRRNRDRRLAYAKQNFEKNRARAEARRRVVQSTPEWKAKNAERTRRVRQTIIGKLNHRMHSRIRACLGRGAKSFSLQDVLGFTVEELRTHLERQFQKGMTWENAGEWHVDHIIPLASFSFTSVDDPEFKAAWALTNLRPLWKGDNLKKNKTRLHLL